MPNTLSHVSFPDFSEIGGFRYQTLFDSLDGFLIEYNSDGSVLLKDGYVELFGGSLNDSYASLTRNTWLPPFLKTFDRKTIIEANIDIFVGYEAFGDALFYILSMANDVMRFGFKFRPAGVYGFSRNDIDETEVPLKSENPSGWNDTLLLKAILIPGLRVDFYIDNVFVNSIDSNIPSGDSGSRLFSFSASGAEGLGSYTLLISSALFYQDT